MFSGGSHIHKDCKKEQMADSQDLEIIENDSKWVSKVRICYNSENHRADFHQGYKQRTICKEKQGRGCFANYFVLNALKCLHFRNQTIYVMFEKADDIHVEKPFFFWNSV